MTSLLDRSSRRGGPSPTIGGLPQVNLLPPEIRAARALYRVKRMLLMGLAGVLVLVAAGYGVASLRVIAAEDELAEAQEVFATLTDRKEEYAEVPVVLNRLRALESAREVGFSTEILWTPYFDAIFVVMPQEVWISSIEASGVTPMQSAPEVVDPLQDPSVMTLKFTGRSLTVPKASEWLEKLNSIPGFSHAWVSSVETAEDDEDGVYYVVQSSVQVDASAFEHRFVEGEE